jgi:glycine cleavage system H protein
MMPSPNDRRYLASHEWHQPTDQGLVAIGISAFAVDELTDITYLQVNVTEGTLNAGNAFGEVESVKATSDLYCGIAGEVVEVNQEVIDRPESINDAPYDAWIIKVRPSNPDDVNKLLDATTYDQSHG